MSKKQSTRVYYSAPQEFVDKLDVLAEQLGTTRSAVGGMVAHIGYKWMQAVLNPETLFTPELLANMRQAGVFDDE